MLNDKIKKVLLIYRKKSNLLILGILFFLVFFLLMFMSIYNISRNNISAIEKTYGTSFSIEMIVDKADQDVWEERYIEGIGTLQVYIGPIVDETLVSRIAEEVEAITDFEVGSRVSVMLDEYDPIPGYWNWSYDYFSTYDSSFDSETIEKRKMHMYVTECWHLRNSSRYEHFYNGVFRLVEGRHITPEDTFKSIISKSFAQKNNLKLGDILEIDLHSLNVRASLPIESLGTVETEIVGFFETTYQQVIGQYTDEEDILENWVITDNTTGYALNDLFSDDYALAISQLYVENPEELDDVMKQVKNLDWIDWRYFELVKDDSTYKEAVKPLRSMKTIMIISMIVVLISGILLLYLVITHSMKKRVRETGILMSLGITGKKIRKWSL